MSEDTLLDTSCVLDGKRYSLLVDEGRVGWQKVGHVDLHGVNPAIPVSAEWNMDFANGMGVSEFLDTESYAFSQGVWAGTRGRVHLSPRKVKVTPTRVPVDKGAWFFEDAPSGNAKFSTGSFTVTGSTQSVAHGLGTTPKAVIFMITGSSSDGNRVQNLPFGVGWSDGTNNAGVTYYSEDNQTTSDTQRSYSNTRSIILSEVNDAYSIEGHVTGFDSTNFDITWTSNGDENEIVQFYALGGPDVEASVDEVTLAGSSGNQSVTGVGFQPDTVMFLGAGFDMTSAGHLDDATITIGAMDSSGNQWAHAMFSADGVGTSDTWSRSSSSKAFLLWNASAGDTTAPRTGAYTSMDTDGYTFNLSNSGNSALISSLSLKGVQVKVGTTTKKTSTGNQAAETIGFTTESFLTVGSRHVTSLDSNTDDASFGLGMVAGTSSVQAAAIHDEDSQGTTDTDRAFDTGAATIFISDTAITDEATCGDIDMETAGWLNWSAASGTASQLHYIGFAANPTSEVRMIHYTNGQSLTKMSVSSNAITEEESHDWGNDAVSGEPEKFNGVWYVPLGPNATAQKITAIGDSGTDNTYAAAQHSGADISAHAFAFVMDGSTSKILRGIDHYVDTSADGATWSGGTDGSSGFEVGDPDTNITNVKTTANRTAVAKEDNLYTVDPATGASEKVTPFSTATTHEHNGQGLQNVEGADAVVYNHHSGLLYFDFSRLPEDISPNAMRTNTDMVGITHEPYGGHYHEATVASPEWSYVLTTVEESSSSKTYILALHRNRQSGEITWHSFDALDGVARGIFVDSKQRLWVGWVSDGSIFYYKLSSDGSPHQRRDNIGFGADSETARLYFPRTDFGHPTVTKRLHSVEAIVESSATGLTLKGAFHLDGGSEATPLGSNLTATYTRSKWTVDTNDTCYYCVPVLQFVTSGYTPSGANRVEIQKYRINAFLEPAAADFMEAYQATIDTGVPFEGGTQPPDDALTMRSNLSALKGGGPVTGIGPDGASGTYIITDVSDNVRLTTYEGQRLPTWVIELSMAKWA